MAEEVKRLSQEEYRALTPEQQAAYRMAIDPVGESFMRGIARTDERKSET